MANPDLARIVAEHDEEMPSRSLSPRWERALWIAGLLIALLVLKQVFFPFAKGSQYYLIIFLAVTLPLVFLSYGRGHTPPWWDWVLALLAFVVGAYPLFGGYDEFLNRQGQLSTLDVIAGAVLLVLILEACRRTTGWVLPVVCLAFIAYAYYGGFLPPSWSISHSGVD
ncbi:MAG: hypothetical protein QOF58_6167, partial [Pseudonocardiales bacterium]|nr:hypothetical protein [Pseudonocardiales bacterium]